MPELTDGRGINPIGIIMSMHLFEAQHENTSGQPQLRLLCSYENGAVMLWGYTNKVKMKSIEGVGWELLWNAKLHVESGKHRLGLVVVVVLIYLIWYSDVYGCFIGQSSCVDGVR